MKNNIYNRDNLKNICNKNNLVYCTLCFRVYQIINRNFSCVFDSPFCKLW